MNDVLIRDLKGMDEFRAADGTALHPPVAPVFYAFRLMVGVGMLMLAVSWVGWWRMRRASCSRARSSTE
jgi:cytochrome d ubiquinol oxidase subunit I